MQDWKGNEIQVGQHVLIIRVSSFFGGGEVHTYARLSDADPWQISKETLPEEYLWTIEHRLLITAGKSATFHMNLNSGEMTGINLSIAEMMLKPNSGQIIAIEGVSDNREEYYLEKFKA